MGKPIARCLQESLRPQARQEPKEIGWTKGLDLVKVAKRDRQKFNCATWLHKDKTLPQLNLARGGIRS